MSALCTLASYFSFAQPLAISVQKRTGRAATNEKVANSVGPLIRNLLDSSYCLVMSDSVDGLTLNCRACGGCRCDDLIFVLAHFPVDFLGSIMSGLSSDCGVHSDAFYQAANLSGFGQL